MGKAYRSRQCRDYQTIQGQSPEQSSPQYPEFSQLLGGLRTNCKRSLGGKDFLNEFDEEQALIAQAEAQSQESQDAEVIPNWDLDPTYDEQQVNTEVEAPSTQLDPFEIAMQDRDLYADGAQNAGLFMFRQSVEGTYDKLPERYVPGLGERKKLWADAVAVAGGTQDEACIILAQLMTEDYYGRAHDASKDQNTDGSTNYSNLNLNQDMLYTARFGGELTDHFWGSPGELNQDAQINVVAVAAIRIMRTMGVDRYLHFVRGGRTGYNSPGEDETLFTNSVREIAKELATDPDKFTDNTRIAYNIDWR